MHLNDFDDDHLPLAGIDDADMLLCLHTAAANASDVLPPLKNYKDIHGRPDEEECRATCVEEFKGKVANDTFDLVKRAKKTLICKSKWFFTNKLNNDGTLERRKDRWVHCGYSQRSGVHFDKIFTATAKATSISIIFALVALFDLELKGIYVVKAFTQEMLSDADLHCEQMDGFG
eukprot:1575308-Pleurochrysis_carterae.AAC.1